MSQGSQLPSPDTIDETRQPGIIATVIVVTILAIVVVGLRLATRKWVVKNIGWDDWTMLAAIVRYLKARLLFVIKL